MPERGELEDRQVEAAAVERHQGAPELLEAVPEGAHEGLLVAPGRDGRDAREAAVVVHVADDDRARHVEGNGEEIRARPAPRDDLLARLLEGLLLADVLVAMEDGL